MTPSSNTPVAQRQPTGRTGKPDLSVVVIPIIGPAPLVNLLSALDAQRTDRVEVIVACDSLIGDIGAFRERFPGIDFVWFLGRRTPAELRATGVARAAADILALVEDHCLPTPDWCASILAAHAETPAVAIGGAIDKGFQAGRRTDTALNWAIYLADYSRYMLPLPAGPGPGASDCNGSYKRAALEETRDHWQLQFHENVINAVLRDRGHVPWFAPNVVVHEQRQLTWRQALHDRYAFGRLFGSTRVAGAPLVRRAVMSAAATLLPPLLVFRVARNVVSRRRYRFAFLRAAFPLAAVASAWVIGELLGYVTGKSERSLAGKGAHAPGPVVPGLD